MKLFVIGILNFVLIQAKDPEWFTYPGNINIGFLLNLHSRNETELCSQVNPAAVQQLLAGVWSTGLLNSEEKNDSIEFGLTIMDSCGSPDIATRQIFRLLKRSENCSSENKNPLVGVIAVGEIDVLTSISSLLSSFSIPFVIASPGGQSRNFNSENILVTSPDLVSQVKPLVSLLKTFSWTSVRLISSSSAALEEFTSAIMSSNVAMSQSLLVTNNIIPENGLKRLIDNTNSNEMIIVVTLLSPEELFQMITILTRHLPLNNILWIVASPSLDRLELKTKISPVLGCGLFLEIHSPNLSGFRTFFFDSLTKINKHPIKLQNILDEYTSQTFNCSWTQTSSSFPSKSCKELDTKKLDSIYHQHPGVDTVAEAVSALAAGFRILTLDFCGGSEKCAAKEPLAPRMLPTLRKLGYSFRKDVQRELEGSHYQITGSGKLIAVHNHVVFFNGSLDPTLIGWYSEDIGISINNLPSFLSYPTSSIYWQANKNINESEIFLESTYLHTSDDIIYDIHMEKVSRNASVRRPWAAATLALSGIGILGTIYILVYVIVKIYDRTLTGNQFFGVCLLFSVAMLYITCVLFVLPPAKWTCQLRIIIHPTVHALCYSVILVKILGLRSLVQLGLGGSVNNANLGFTLIVLVGLQLAIVTEYVLLVDITPNCDMKNQFFVYLHIPAIVILFVAAIFGFFSRHIRRNYQEIISLLLVSIVCITVWLGWVILVYSAPNFLLEPAVCAHLLTIATVVMIGVFVPKLRTMRKKYSAYDHKKLSNKKIRNDATNKISVNTIFHPDILSAEGIHHSIYAPNLCSFSKK